MDRDLERLWNMVPSYTDAEIRTMKDRLRDPRPVAGGADDPDPDDADKDKDTPDDSDKDEPDHAAEAKKWKELARKHEKRAKENADKAKKLDEIEEASKSEIDKAKEAEAAEKRRADEAEAKALRLEIASEKNLTPAQAKRLVGATREELESDADELLESFKAPEPTDDGGRPKERLKPGASPDADAERSADEIVKSIPRL